MIKISSRDYLFDIVQKFDPIKKLFIYYCKQHDIKLLNQYYKVTQKHRAIANNILKNAFEEKDDKKHIDLIKESNKIYKERFPIDAVLTDELLELYEIQTILSKELKDNGIIGMTVNETFYICLVNLHFKEVKKQAIRLKKNFQIPEKRYWWIKVNALSFLNDWEGLEKFSKKEKVSPIGYVPFVEACLKKKPLENVEGGQDEDRKIEEAKKYIPLIKNPDVKVEYYVQLKMFKAAIECAMNAKSIDLLQYIYDKTNNSKTKDTILNVIKQLQ
jgi:vacuolar protein sorting-associated protein 16